jgi:transcriptional antiterminator RfaH
LAAVVESEWLDSDAAWYLVYTKPRQERVAHINLQQQGFFSYLPLFKTFAKAEKPKDGLKVLAEAVFEPMFARYVFFRPGNPRQSISAARSTRGVSTIVAFGFVPAVVQPAMLVDIRACEQERNRVDITAISPFQPGSQVRLRGAGLQGLQGLVQSVSAKRVTLLLEILGRQKLVGVEHHQIELV